MADLHKETEKIATKSIFNTIAQSGVISHKELEKKSKSIDENIFNSCLYFLVKNHFIMEINDLYSAIIYPKDYERMVEQANEDFSQDLTDDERLVLIRLNFCDKKTMIRSEIIDEVGKYGATYSESRISEIVNSLCRKSYLLNMGDGYGLFLTPEESSLLMARGG